MDTMRAGSRPSAQVRRCTSRVRADRPRVQPAGCGWAQRAGGAMEEIRRGGVVWFSPGERHWHGAAGTGVRHIAVQEKLDGSPVEWLEVVTEVEYRMG